MVAALCGSILGSMAIMDRNLANEGVRASAAITSIIAGLEGSRPMCGLVITRTREFRAQMCGRSAPSSVCSSFPFYSTPKAVLTSRPCGTLELGFASNPRKRRGA